MPTAIAKPVRQREPRAPVCRRDDVLPSIMARIAWLAVTPSLMHFCMNAAFASCDRRVSMLSLFFGSRLLVTGMLLILQSGNTIPVGHLLHR
jgi:hypothetical protein